jgi:hypothetical protein
MSVRYVSRIVNTMRLFDSSCQLHEYSYTSPLPIKSSSLCNYNHILQHYLALHAICCNILKAPALQPKSRNSLKYLMIALDTLKTNVNTFTWKRTDRGFCFAVVTQIFLCVGQIILFLLFKNVTCQAQKQHHSLYWFTTRVYDQENIAFFGGL